MPSTGFVVRTICLGMAAIQDVVSHVVTPQKECRLCDVCGGGSPMERGRHRRVPPGGKKSSRYQSYIVESVDGLLFPNRFQIRVIRAEALARTMQRQPARSPYIHQIFHHMAPAWVDVVCIPMPRKIPSLLFDDSRNKCPSLPVCMALGGNAALDLASRIGGRPCDIFPYSYLLQIAVLSSRVAVRKLLPS